MAQIKKLAGINFLYIGSVIGAGFATGREIMQFFGDSSIYAAISSGFLLGLFSTIFLYVGNQREYILKKYQNKMMLIVFLKGMKITVAVCGFLSFAVMCSAMETLMRITLNIRYTGLVIGIITSFIGMGNISKLKTVNMLLVPLIVITMCVMACFTHIDLNMVGLNIINIVSYAALNLILGGCLMIDEGKKLSLKEIVICGVSCAIIFAALVGVGYFVSINNKEAEMPVYIFAKTLHAGWLSAFVIFAAIFTTILSSSKIVLKEGGNYLPSCFFIILLILTSILFYSIEFSKCVTKIYPIIAIVGILYTLAMIGYCMFIIINKLVDKRKVKS